MKNLNLVDGRMKKPTIVLVFLCMVGVCTVYSQNFSCPLENGTILVFERDLFSHSDPAYGVTIFSASQDNVQAVLGGQVLDVLKSGENTYTVLVRTGEITVAYKYMRTATVTKYQNVEFRSSLGTAQKTDSVGFKLDVSIVFGRERVDPREFLPCVSKVESKE